MKLSEKDAIVFEHVWDTEEYSLMMMEQKKKSKIEGDILQTDP